MNNRRFNNPWLWLRLLLPVTALAFAFLGWLSPPDPVDIRIFRLPLKYSDFASALLGCMLLLLAGRGGASRSKAPGRGLGMVNRILPACVGLFLLFATGFIVKERIARIEQTALLAQTAKLQKEFDRTVTPLMRAAGQGDVDRMRNLLDQGADMQARDQIDLSALDYACGAMPSFAGNAKGSPEAVQLLLDRGADINAAGKQGRSPLMYAVRTRNLRLVKLLITHGADVRRISRDGHSALFYAHLDHSDAVTELLKASGATSVGPGEQAAVTR